MGQTGKAAIVKFFGPRAIRVVKRMLGRAGFDEIDIVHAACRDLGLSADSRMIDVGAHHGTAFERFEEDGWLILAFEPDDRNRAYLRKIYGQNDRVEIRSEAVSDAVGEATFFASDVATTISSLSAFHESHHEAQTVKTVTLAEFTRDFESVEFLKIDTEGHDLFVLKGYDWSLPPLAIVCEFENRKTVPLGYTLADMVTFLEGNGYTVIISEWEPIVEYGRQHTWRRFTRDPAAVAPAGWGNLIAAKTGTGMEAAILARTGHETASSNPTQ